MVPGDVAAALAVLGLDESASSAEVKRTRNELLEMLHPDKHDSNPKLRERANRQSQQIIDAARLATQWIDHGRPRGPNNAPGRAPGTRSAPRSGGDGGGRKPPSPPRPPFPDWLKRWPPSRPTRAQLRDLLANYPWARWAVIVLAAVTVLTSIRTVNWAIALPTTTLASIESKCTQFDYSSDPEIPFWCPDFSPGSRLYTLMEERDLRATPRDLKPLTPTLMFIPRFFVDREESIRLRHFLQNQEVSWTLYFSEWSSESGGFVASLYPSIPRSDPLIREQLEGGRVHVPPIPGLAPLLQKLRRNDLVTVAGTLHWGAANGPGRLTLRNAELVSHRFLDHSLTTIVVDGEEPEDCTREPFIYSRTSFRCAATWERECLVEQDYDSCLSFAAQIYYQEKHISKRGFDLSISLAESLCERSVKRCSLQIGMYLHEGLGSGYEARGHLDHGCFTQNDPLQCTKLGRWDSGGPLPSGEEPVRQLWKARRAFERGCVLDFTEACDALQALPVE